MIHILYAGGILGVAAIAYGLAAIRYALRQDLPEC